jgi:RNA polymerase sigma factor FliA
LQNLLLNPQKKRFQELTMNSQSKKQEIPEIRQCVDWAKKFVTGLWGKIPPSADSDDLLGAALLGLAESLDRYDPNKNASLKTYAQKRMVGAIKDELRRQDPLSRGQRHRMRKLQEKKHKEELSGDTALDPKEKEEMNKLRLLSSNSRPLHLDETPPPQITMKRSCPEELCHKNRIRNLIKDHLGRLGSRNRRILDMLYFQGLTTVEVGHRLGLSQSRISQIRSSCLQSLKDKIHPEFQVAA